MISTGAVKLAPAGALDLCVLCFQGLGHVLPAYTFAKRINSLRKEEADRHIGRSEFGPSIYHPLGLVRTTIFCQVHIDDLPVLKNMAIPTETIDIVVRVISSTDIESLGRLNDDDDEESKKAISDKLSKSFRVFGQDTMSGAWAKRVIQYYKVGWESVVPADKLCYETRLKDHEGIKFQHLTLRRNLPLAETNLSKNPDCVIADMFVAFDGDVADALNKIPCWAFHPSNLVMAGFDYTSMTMKLDEVSEFKLSDIWKEGNDDISHIESSRRPFRKGIIVNDVEDWYSYSILDHVAHSNCKGKKNLWDDGPLRDQKNHQTRYSEPWEVLCVGPLLYQDLKPPSHNNDLLTQWLENIEAKKLNFIFITMGSQFNLSEETVKNLQALIESSLKNAPNTRYLWARRDRSEISSFQDCESDLLILPWVDQVAVLQHPNLLGVITHAGWNGLLETMSLTDAAVLCVPLGAEQGINSRCVENYYQNGKILKHINEDQIRKKAFNETFTLSRASQQFEKTTEFQNANIYKHMAYKAFNNSSKKNIYKFLNSLI